MLVKADWTRHLDLDRMRREYDQANAELDRAEAQLWQALRACRATLDAIRPPDPT